MKGDTAAATCVEEGVGLDAVHNDSLYSVEFSLRGLELSYQFKLWHASPNAMFVLAREDSSLLKWLQPGDILMLKYYTTDKYRPIRNCETEIKFINEGDQGRFKGHCCVGLEILGAGLQALTP